MTYSRAPEPRAGLQRAGLPRRAWAWLLTLGWADRKGRAHYETFHGSFTARPGERRGETAQAIRGDCITRLPSDYQEVWVVFWSLEPDGELW